MNRKLFSKKEAAEILGKDVRDLENMVARGQLPVVRVRSCVRYRWRDVFSLIAEVDSSS